MFKNSHIAQSVRLAFMFAGTASLMVTAVQAEESEEKIERIHITGSSIKRTDIEGSLPITSISSSDIARSGVTSVPDLMQKIPQMQGFVTAADSVGGGGGGQQTASLRDLGGEYTLVLVNGRRLATAASGSAVDLTSIPLAAIERVDVLTDGASAIYGSDAIVGVINFIMKSDFQGININGRVDRPQESGGESHNFSITTGYGDLENDGYNLMLSYSHDNQEELLSSQRSFANTGIIPFSYQGNDLIWQRTSANAIPGNAYLTFNDGSSRSFNPYREENGQCADKNAPSGSTCVYDFTETLRIYPESNRDNLFAQAIVEVSENAELYATASYSRFSLISRIAPYPTGVFSIPNDSSLVQENILPHLTDEEAAVGISQVDVRWRTRPGGNRTDDWQTDSQSFLAGIRGDIEDLSYDLAISFSDTDQDNVRITGYPLEDALTNLLESGRVNIFVPPEELTEEQNQMVADTMFNGSWLLNKTSLASIEGRASMPVFEMPEGDVYIGAGFDFREQGYEQTISEANRNEVVLFQTAQPEFDLKRENYGLYLETVVPLAEGLEITGALRYDNVGKITDSRRESDKTVNKDESDTTYKISVAYRPNDEWLVRASIGTGFKSATMRQIAAPRIDFGVTSSAYDCPFPTSDPRSAGCFSEKLQYNVFREGFAELKPETSEQKSLGFVYSPDNLFSVNVDWWQVNLENQVQRLTQDQIFGDPVLYSDLFTTKLNRGTGKNELAIIQAAVNIGQANNEGIDWGVNVTNEFNIGTLKTAIQGTYIMESERLRIGTDDTFDTSLGQWGDNQKVTFRNIINIANTFSHDNFEHSFNIYYRSGYQDQYHAGGGSRIRLASDINENFSGGVQLQVPSYATANFTTTYFVNDDLNMTFGINNVMDKTPPLSLRTGGAGHQAGYDPRYTDVLGRTFYISADYTFK